MTGLLVLATSITVAFFLGRGLEPWAADRHEAAGRRRGGRRRGAAGRRVIVSRVEATGGQVATFLGFASGVILIGYMVLAGAWALRFLADQAAQYR